MVFGGFWPFFFVLFGSLWLMVVLNGLWWFFGGSVWFLVVLGVFVVLGGSWQFLGIIGGLFVWQFLGIIGVFFCFVLYSSG